MKTDLTKIDFDDGNWTVLCLIADFGISGAEISGDITTDSISLCLILKYIPYTTSVL
jgi:hypothetical protein